MDQLLYVGLAQIVNISIQLVKIQLEERHQSVKIQLEERHQSVA